MKILVSKIIEVLGEKRVRQLGETGKNGEIVISLEDKLNSLFKDRYRMYSDRVLEATAIFNIDRRLDLDFVRLSQWDSLITKLTNADAYKYRTEFDNSKDINNKDDLGTSLDRFSSGMVLSKTRNGTAQSGEEFDLQETWNKEDKLVFDTYDKSKIKRSLTTAQENDLEIFTHEISGESTSFSPPVVEKTSEGSEGSEDEELVFNAVDINAGRTFTDTRSGLTALKKKQQILKTKQTGNRIKFTEADVIRRSWNSHLAELKSLIINEFVFCLTKKYCGNR